MVKTLFFFPLPIRSLSWAPPKIVQGVRWMVETLFFFPLPSRYRSPCAAKAAECGAGPFSPARRLLQGRRQRRCRCGEVVRSVGLCAICQTVKAAVVAVRFSDVFRVSPRPLSARRCGAPSHPSHENREAWDVSADPWDVFGRKMPPICDISWQKRPFRADYDCGIASYRFVVSELQFSLICGRRHVRPQISHSLC